MYTGILMSISPCSCVSHVPEHIKGTHKWNTHLCAPLGLHSTSFSMCCIAQGDIGMEPSVYICSCRLVEYCANQNATPEIVRLFQIESFTCLLIAHHKRLVCNQHFYEPFMRNCLILETTNFH